MVYISVRVTIGRQAFALLFRRPVACVTRCVPGRHGTKAMHGHVCSMLHPNRQLPPICLTELLQTHCIMQPSQHATPQQVYHLLRLVPGHLSISVLNYNCERSEPDSIGGVEKLVQKKTKSFAIRFERIVGFDHEKGVPSAEHTAGHSRPLRILRSVIAVAT